MNNKPGIQERIRIINESKFCPYPKICPDSATHCDSNQDWRLCASNKQLGMVSKRTFFMLISADSLDQKKDESSL